MVTENLTEQEALQELEKYFASSIVPPRDQYPYPEWLSFSELLAGPANGLSPTKLRNILKDGIGKCSWERVLVKDDKVNIYVYRRVG